MGHPPGRKTASGRKGRYVEGDLLPLQGASLRKAVIKNAPTIGAFF